MKQNCIYLDYMNDITGAEICSATGKECEHSACECYSDPECLESNSEETEK